MRITSIKRLMSWLDPTKGNFLFPQDILVRPKSFGRNVDPVSAKLDNREYFGYVWNVNNGVAVPNTGGIFQASTAISEEFDYWIANVVIAGIDTVLTPNTVSASVPGLYKLVDDEQGFEIINTAAAAYNYLAGGGATRATMPMPYVIRAGQTFTQTLDVAAHTTANPKILQVVIDGWKDYSY